MNSKGDQEPIDDRTRSRVAYTPSLPPFEARHLPLNVPAAARTGSRTVSQNLTTPSCSRALAEKILTHAAYSVLDNETGKLINYGQLRRHPQYK